MFNLKLYFDAKKENAAMTAHNFNIQKHLLGKY